MFPPPPNGTWGEVFVASLAWALLMVIGVMLAGISIPISVPLLIYGIGSYAYKLFCEEC